MHSLLLNQAWPAGHGILVLAAASLVWAAPVEARTCSKFRTCAEAMRALEAGNTRLDSDGDGIPCESLCKGRPAPAASQQLSSPAVKPAPAVRPAQGPAPSARRPKQPANPAAPLPAGPVELISVGDGDTIRVRGTDGRPITVRLACIDAPEPAQGWPGSYATAALRQLLAGGSLQLRPQTVDRYGRTVAEVIASGRNVNLEMVRSGAAFVYHQYLSQCDASTYEQAEQQAEQTRQGVWRLPGGAERPWDFRSTPRQP